jgi:TonB family protein
MLTLGVAHATPPSADDHARAGAEALAKKKADVALVEYVLAFAADSRPERLLGVAQALEASKQKAAAIELYEKVFATGQGVTAAAAEERLVALGAMKPVAESTHSLIAMPPGAEASPGEGIVGVGNVGVGNVGLIGKGGGGGTGAGYGRGSGAHFGGRGARVPPVRQAKAEVKGKIDKDVISRVVRSHINEVSHCYNEGLVKDPNLKGRVLIQFTIGPTGNVPVAVVHESSVKDVNVGQCIAKAVKRWKFPKPVGGGNVVVTYPFLLEPGGG